MHPKSDVTLFVKFATSTRATSCAIFSKIYIMTSRGHLRWNDVMTVIRYSIWVLPS